jgi:hypothetical protein
MADNTIRGRSPNNHAKQRDYDTQSGLRDSESETDEYTPAQIREATRAADDAHNQTTGRAQVTRPGSCTGR